MGMNTKKMRYCGLLALSFAFLIWWAHPAKAEMLYIEVEVRTDGGKVLKGWAPGFNAFGERHLERLVNRGDYKGAQDFILKRIKNTQYIRGPFVSKNMCAFASQRVVSQYQEIGLRLVNIRCRPKGK